MPYDVENMFRYHPPCGTQTERYERIRAAARGLARVIQQNSPPSAEQTLALRDLESCVMRANQAIAVNETAGQAGAAGYDPAWRG